MGDPTCDMGHTSHCGHSKPPSIVEQTGRVGSRARKVSPGSPARRRAPASVEERGRKPADGIAVALRLTPQGGEGQDPCGSALHIEITANCLKWARTIDREIPA
jgi:hypothetical protein